MLPDLVEADELLAAISLSSAQFNLGRVIGPALAGVAIVAGSYGLAFALNAASFLAVLMALLVVRPRRPARVTESPSLRQRLAEGARVAAAEPGCRGAIILIAVVALLVSPFIALVPAVALELFHQQAKGTSVLVTAQGIGAVVGALALASLVARWGRRRANEEWLGKDPTKDPVIATYFLFHDCGLATLQWALTTLRFFYPERAYREKIELTPAIPSTYVVCGQVVEIDAGHCPHVSRLMSWPPCSTA